MTLLIAKLAVAVVLFAGVALAAWGRAPRTAPEPGALYRLVAGALCAYAAGVAALLARAPLLATFAFAVGAAAASLAAWLSRGGTGEDPGPAEDDPDRVPPPPDPDLVPGTDWERFDRARRGWERRPTPTR